STAEQFIGEGADVIFGAGGPTGSGGIRNGAEQGIYVIGVDQDEYNTTFGGGSAPGAENLISSAVKRVDLGVYDQLKGLVEPDSDLWAGGGLYILDAANGGITYAPFHDAEDSIPDAVKDRLEEIREMLASGDLNTGVDPIGGDVLEGEIPEPVPFDGSAASDGAADDGADDGAMAEGGLKKACLVTDLGNVNDGTFNEFAYTGMVSAQEEFGIETTFIETQSETDYAKNIDTCVQEGYEAVITVGFLIADATLEAASANPDTMFIGVDQFFEAPPENLVGIQYREDQGGFLAGALACMMTESDLVGGVYGIDIPPVVKFRNGFENGCQYVNPDASALGVYIPSFTDAAQGASTAEQFIGEGADVIFGAGGPTGSGGIRNGAEQGIYVIGVDQDEYNTTFGGGSAPGAENLISSAVKRVDLGVYDQLKGLIDPSSDLWAGGGLYILDAANGGITYAPFHDAEDSIPDAVKDRLEEIREMLASGDLNTGVDPIGGDVLEGEIPEPVPFEK
ncbi:MAG: BMP family lipoprotein, partial [Ardenticatenaceae bacterium]